jgi:hypothetical protein
MEVSKEPPSLNKQTDWPNPRMQPTRHKPHATDARRCYDFRGQELVASFWIFMMGFSCRASEEPEPVRSDG